MKRPYESIDDIIEFHDKQENCIWRNGAESLLGNHSRLDLIRLYMATMFSLVAFLESRFREIIWDAHEQDEITQKLQKEFKHRKSEYVSFTKIFEHLDQILENCPPDQLNLLPETLKRLREYKPKIIIGIGFRNWFAHGGWDRAQQKKIFDSESIELVKCQDLYKDMISICRDFEKHIFDKTKKL